MVAFLKSRPWEFENTGRKTVSRTACPPWPMLYGATRSMSASQARRGPRQGRWRRRKNEDEALQALQNKNVNRKVTAQALPKLEFRPGVGM
jgi:hypothetical protein